MFPRAIDVARLAKRREGGIIRANGGGGRWGRERPV